MEGFSTQHHHSYCDPQEPLLAGFPANLDETAAAMAFGFECSTSSPPLSMEMQQLQESFPLSFGAETAAAGLSFPLSFGDKRRRMVSIERSSTSSLGSAQELDGSGGKMMISTSGKHKRSSNGSVAGGVKGKRASKGHGVDAKVEDEAAAGLRRERINEKMKMLQSLVPGCDKLAGRALLDEIIGYVQSLQSQVEFLSTKLASLNPTTVYEHLGLDVGGMCHRHPDAAPRVVKMSEMPSHELVQWMGHATATSASLAEAQGGVPAGATAGLAQDGSGSSSSKCVDSIMQMLQLQRQEEEELSMSFFQQYV